MKRNRSAAQPEPEFIQYASAVGEAPATVEVDVSLVDDVPISSRPELFWIGIPLKDPDKTLGWPGEEEADLLDTMVEALLESLGDLVRMVGHLTANGAVELYFYGGSGKFSDFKHRALKALKRYQNYQFEFGERSDPQWSHYRDVLLPTDEEYDEMLVMEALEDYYEGESWPDEVETAPVLYFFGFGSAEHRDACATRGEAVGMSRESRLLGDGESEFSLCLSREDALDVEELEQAIQDMRGFAAGFSGELLHFEVARN